MKTTLYYLTIDEKTYEGLSTVLFPTHAAMMTALEAHVRYAWDQYFDYDDAPSYPAEIEAIETRVDEAWSTLNDEGYSDSTYICGTQEIELPAQMPLSAPRVYEVLDLIEEKIDEMEYDDEPNEAQKTELGDIFDTLADAIDANRNRYRDAR